MGSGNVIGPFCLLRGPLIMGDGNLLSSHVCLGSAGQETKNPRYDDRDALVRIGSGNTIREFSAIQKPYHEAVTSLGDNVFVMQSVHVPHDCVVESDAVLTPMVVLAGLSRIMRGANVAIHASVNQFVVVGAYSIVASGSNVRANVRPFTRAIPGKLDSVNHYALRKFGFESFVSEINDYVLEGKQPMSPRVGHVVAEYERVCGERVIARGRI